MKKLSKNLLKDLTNNTMFTLKLTKEELERIKYHIEYDMETLDDNERWKDIGLDRKTSEKVWNKLCEIKLECELVGCGIDKPHNESLHD